jgi:pentose-5-phosphate-3-epimerase
VDIGINTKTAPELRKVGVSGLVSGSAVFASTGSLQVSEEIKKNIQNLLK